MPKAKNPHVFLDISIGGRAAERITFELFANVVPKTAENFRALCTGERGLGASTQKPLCYKQTNIHRIVKGFVAQGGDFSRGDGSGGESIYGGKFPDENFKLQHGQSGVLSMANAGANSNGSQFFITFKPLPHLDGKHVVFGRVVSGIDFIKKLEAVGSDSGKPTCLVKIVDSGEVSQDHLRGEKEKKLRDDAEGRVKTKKPPSDDKRRNKRKHYSSDSDSSDTSDSRSYSLDSGTESESYSSSSLDTSSSSDHRHKRRKSSKKAKPKSPKTKSSHKKSKRKSRGTKRKSKRSYGSSSDDSSSSSSESENEGRRTKNSSKKNLLITDHKNSEMVNLEKGRTLKDADKSKQTVATGDISMEGSKPSNIDENAADGIQNSKDGSNKFRDDTSRSSPIMADANLTQEGGNNVADAADAGISRAGTERNPISNEPVPTNGKDLAMGSTDNGQPQRVRKGRGFTRQYRSARRYWTPSPERSPVRSHYNGGRNDRWNYFNRYGRNGPYGARSPVRRYHGSQRASSPSRYPRRDRSRSRSRSPARHRDRGGYRRDSPRRNRSRSPTEQQRRDRDVSSRPRSGRGGGGGGGSDRRGGRAPVNRGRSRSRPKSRDPSRSRSPDTAPVKKGSSKYNRRRSSSSRSSSLAGSKGLVSY